MRCGVEQREQGLLARDPVLNHTDGGSGAIHGRPPTIVRGRPCCFARERAECSSEAGYLAWSLWHCDQEVAMLVREHVTRSRDGQEDRYGFDGPCYVVPFPLLKGRLGSMGW